MWYWGGGWHWWDWLVGVVVMVAFWTVIMWALWILVGGLLGRREGDRREGDRRSTSATRILDERLARGEIGPEEYRSLRQVLEGDGRADDQDRAPEEGGHRPGGRERVGR